MRTENSRGSGRPNRPSRARTTTSDASVSEKYDWSVAIGSEVGRGVGGACVYGSSSPVWAKGTSELGGAVPHWKQTKDRTQHRGRPRRLLWPTININKPRARLGIGRVRSRAAGCSIRPVRPLMRTRRRRRATARGTKRGICQARRWPVAPRARAADSPTAATQRTEDRAPFASLSGLFEEQHRKARRCSQQAT